MVDVRKVFQTHLKTHTVGFWVWLGATVIAVVFVITLVSQIFFVSATLAREAIDAGQSVVIHIASGEIEGSPRHTKLDKGDTFSGSENGAGGKESTIISKEGLAPAPLVSITEETDRGLIPIIARDGTVPWKYYARPFKTTEKHPQVAIVLTNLGLSRPQAEEVIKLPHNFTLSFSPYASDAKKWAKKAREEGFESLVDLPMESATYPAAESGPYGLLSDLNANDNSIRMHWALSRFPGFVGTLAPVDEKFTANLTAVRPMLTELAARGVLFLYIKNVQNSGLADLIKTQSFTALGVDKVIDDDTTTPGAMDTQLQSLTDLAKAHGYAIGVAHSYPSTLEELTSWSDTLKDQGVDLVPVSAIALKVFP